MKDLVNTLCVVLVQFTPVLFNKAATLDKACAQIREAVRASMEFDPCGHHARPDMTKFILRGE